MIWCFHTKLSDIKDGLQYCLKCNKAFRAPCAHRWVEKISVEMFSYEESKTPYAIRNTDKCSLCGEVRTYML
jgi:hypothetical protein